MSDVIVGYVSVHTTAEVHDKDGNLISSTPLELSRPVTAEELAEHERNSK